jgi:hypothetical protein
MLELFFDMVFVFTITEVRSVLACGLSSTGVLQVVLIFVVMLWMYGGTPASRRAPALPADRVVARTVRPRRLARIATVRPTDDVPPRISRVWPGCTSSPTVRAVGGLQHLGHGPESVVHGNSLRNGIAARPACT